MISNMEFIGLIAGALELVGLWLIGSKKRTGFVLAMIGNIFWIIFSAITHSALGLIMVCSAAFILNLRAYNNWNNKTQ